MDGTRLARLVQRGYRIAGDRVGLPHRHFRPNQRIEPINQAGQLPDVLAAFDRVPTFAYTGQARYGEAARFGILDGLAVLPGDYLLPFDETKETVFVSAPGAIHASTCVACNATISVRRTVGLGAQEGFVGYRAEVADEEVLLDGWPVSILAKGTTGTPEFELPGQMPIGQWTVLMPRLVPEVRLQASDVLLDQDGRRLVVMTAEQSLLGWRLVARTLGAG